LFFVIFGFSENFIKKVGQKLGNNIEQNKNQKPLQEDSSTSVPTTTQEDAEPSEPNVYVRRSSRTIKPPQRFTLLLNYILLTDGGEPLTYEESLQDGNSSKWELAMKDMMDSLLKNKT
jgi:hypothetical protein